MTRRPRRSGLKWVALVFTLVAIAWFCRGFFYHLHKKAYPPNAFYHVRRADMLISLTEEGALRALNETVVRSGLEGYNRIIHLVPEGSYVQKGDLLVELDSSGLKDRLSEQELAYQERLFQMLQAKNNFEIQKSLTESQIKDAELAVENAQSDLEKYRDGDAPLLIRTVEARSGVLAEQVRIARERYARTQELFKTQKATKSELEADALSLKREQLGLSQYEEDLRLIKKFDQPNQVRLLQSKVEQATAELERVKQRTSNEIAQAEADLKTSQATIDFLDEGLKTQKRRLENAKILAPQNGLVVYASVSPFQFESSGESRREEGRFRIGGRGGGRGGDDGSLEFRGGGRRGDRGSRFNSESSFSSSSGSGGSSRSSTAETIASGNQRIASAISGSPATDPGSGGAGSAGGAGTGGGGGSAGGAGGTSSGRSGSSGGGQNATSAAGSFASYPSMRPSSAFTSSSAGATNSVTGTTSTGASSSSVSTGSQSAPFSGGNNQFASRSSSQGFRDFSGFEFSGTPGLLEEGIMVRNRQELIRLPDVSKMLAEIKIEEARVAQIKAGMTAYIEVKNIPHRRFKGTVRRVALLPDAQSAWMNPNAKLFPTDVLVDEEMPILKPGVSASVEIIITNLTKVLSVPIQSVARLEGENVCFVKRGSRVTPVSVTTGWFNDCFVEVTSGLKEGDLVLLAPISDEEMDDTSPGDTNEAPHAVEPPEQFRRPGEPADPSRRGEPVDSPRRTDQFDPSRRGESYEPSRSGPAGQEPAPGERRMRRRDPDSPDGAASSERRRSRQDSGRRPQNSQEAPE